MIRLEEGGIHCKSPIYLLFRADLQKFKVIFWD